MAVNVIMPHMGLTTVEGTVVRWLKQEGDEVRKDEPLVEVLTDKVNTQVEAPEPGIVLKIVAREGEVVPVTKTLCWIGRPGEKIPDEGAPSTEESLSASAPEVEPAPAVVAVAVDGYVRASPAAKRLAREQGVNLAEVKGSGPEGRVIEADVMRFVNARSEALAGIAGQAPGAGGPTADLRRPAPAASPLAKNLARELGIDLATVTGTGPGGRVTREDVLLAAEKARTTAPLTATPRYTEADEGREIVEQATQPVVAAPRLTPQPSTPAPPAAAASTVPLAGLRRTIAQRMAQSSQTVARVTHTTEADVTELVRMREQIVAETERLHGVRVSYNDIIVKVVARVLKQYPMMNARLAENEILLLDQVNVGVAVAVPQGLVVPVIHNADLKDLITIANESRDKIERARNGTLVTEDISGGTFTVTNLGSYEIDAFTPIVNLPEVGILGIGRIVEKPAVFEGEITKRSMMYLSLSFDHRVIDGAPAAEFLRAVKHYLEKPYTLLI